jgi:hypothetical protein
VSSEREKDLSSVDLTAISQEPSNQLPLVTSFCEGGVGEPEPIEHARRSKLQKQIVLNMVVSVFGAKFKNIRFAAERRLWQLSGRAKLDGIHQRAAIPQFAQTRLPCLQ